MSNVRINILYAVGGSVISRAVQFITVVVAARYLTPKDFALWPLFLILTQIPAVLGLLRIDIAITIAKSDASALLLSRLCMLISTVIAVITVMGVYLLQIFDPMTFGFEITVDLLPMVFVYIVGSNVITVQQALLTRIMAFRAIAFQSIVSMASALLSVIVLNYLFSLTSHLFILSQIIGVLCGASFGMIGWRRLLGSPFTLNFARALSLLKKYRAYPLYYTPYSLSQTVQERLVGYLVAAAFGLAALGKFYLVRQLFVATANLFTQPLRQLLFSYLLNSNDPRGNAIKLSAMLSVILATTAPLIFVVPSLLQPLLIIFVGKQWEGLELLIFWMSWVAWVIVGVAWIDRVFDVAAKPRFAAVLQLVSDFITVLLLIACLLLRLPFAVFIASYAIAITTYYLLWSSLALYSYVTDWTLASRPPLGALIGVIAGLGANAFADYALPPGNLVARCLIFAFASASALFIVTTIFQLNLFFNRHKTVL